jgi:hypothetical protein
LGSKIPEKLYFYYYNSNNPTKGGFFRAGSMDNMDGIAVGWLGRFIIFSAFSSPRALGETASLSFGSSFSFPKIAVAGTKPTLN